jgi:excisionase family DNA binding protein
MQAELEPKPSELLDSRLLFPKAEAARLLGVSLRTVDYMLARGDLKARRIGKRVLFERSELERFARRDHRGRRAAEAESRKIAGAEEAG